jgi:hypothetical protein
MNASRTGRGAALWSATKITDVSVLPGVTVRVGEFMHHRRKGRKSTRAGCLICKPYKRQGAPKRSRQRHGANRRLAACADQLSGRSWRETAVSDGIRP